MGMSRRPKIQQGKAIALTVLVAAILELSLPAGGAGAPRAEPWAITWTGAWASSQQVPEVQNALPPDALNDATLRQIVRLSVGGERLRVRISNVFGTAPLHLTGVHVARSRSAARAAIDASTDRALTFGGREDVTVPAGADYWSDPIAFKAPALSSLAVTFHIDRAPAQQTSHPGSHATSYLVHGDHVSAADLPDAMKVAHWFELSGVDVAATPNAAAIVALGDSITDGHGVVTDGDNRWPDDLAGRLQGQAATRGLGVLNEGIGGNRLLLDGLGPNALARFDRDVRGQTGVRYLIVLEGVNDLAVLTRDGPASPAEHAALVRHIIGAYGQMVEQARAFGIKAIGATILPYGGSPYYHPTEPNEADRQAVNRWIRTRGHFDAVIDFDRVMRDPQHPDRLRSAYDCGDHLHPSPQGYGAMADAIPLKLFRR
jgi:lysophospholipase L1-like esterase